MRRVLSTFLSSAAMIVAAPLCAQGQPAAQASPATGEQETASDSIVVTGSRIARDGFQAPNPLTVLGSDLLQNLGQVSASETLKIIPQNISTHAKTCGI